VLLGPAVKGSKLGDLVSATSRFYWYVVMLRLCCLSRLIVSSLCATNTVLCRCLL
jgi:hypothetical protein